MFLSPVLLTKLQTDVQTDELQTASKAAQQLGDLGKERTHNFVWMQETFHFFCVYIIKDWVVSRLAINFFRGK